MASNIVTASLFVFAIAAAIDAFAAPPLVPLDPIPTGAESWSVVAADLNGDESIDLAVANFDTVGSVSILLGDGTGKFLDAGRLPVPAFSTAITAGDLDGDATVDLVVGDSQNEGGDTISVLIGVGDGTFAPYVAYPAGSNPNGVAIGDIDADGYADVVVSNGNSNSISIFYGHGDGTLAPRVDYSVGEFPTAVKIADLDGDGWLDVLASEFGAGSPAPSLVVMLGDGHGALSAPMHFGESLAFSFSIATGDLNGDGRLDVAIGVGNAGILDVMFGNGDGTFSEPMGYAVPDIYAVAIADLDPRAGSPTSSPAPSRSSTR